MIQGRNFLTHFVSFRRSHWLWLKKVKQTIRACPSLSKAKTYFGNAWATSFSFFIFLHVGEVCLTQSYEIKSPPWTIVWFRILGIFSFENIDRLGVFMFQT